MQVTKGTWRMREQCVPGSLSSSHAREPGNEANCVCACSCAGRCIYVCESLKFEGGTMVVMVPLQYFQFMNCEGFAMQ